jgi:hypothetical protein
MSWKPAAVVGLAVPFAWFALSAAAVAAPAAAAAPDPSGVPAASRLAAEETSVPMDLSYGKPIVTVRVNGKGPYRFFLDSAAGGTVLDSAFAKELGLVPRNEVRIGDPANPGKIGARAVTIDSLQLGEATFGPFEAVAYDRSRLYDKPDPPKGVLGFPLFHDLLLTFDYPQARVRVSKGAVPRVGGPDLVSYVAPDGVPTIPIVVAGRKIAAHLDTGSPGTLMLPASLQDSIPLTGPLREMGRGRTNGGEFVMKGGTLAQPFTLGGHAFDTLTVRFAPGFKDANVGTGILRSFAVTFDQRRARVRFAYDPRVAAGGAAPAGVADTASAATAPTRRYGIRSRLLPNGTLEVMGIDAGSPASSSGIQPGDLVIALDGKSMAVLTEDELAALTKKPSITVHVRRGANRYSFTMTAR